VRFLADESCAGPIITALRLAGHDVSSIAESAKGAADEIVIAQALEAGRVLVTEDRDFGELVFARPHASAGVMLVRFHRRARNSKPKAVVEAVEKMHERLLGAFTVVEPGRVRIARPPRN
jgi:predicted nuclease of predicted toxin-antitoxin system